MSDASNSLLTLPPSTPAEPTKTVHIRLLFLDGLRGLAALYVVLYHIRLYGADIVAGVPNWAKNLNGWTGYGHVSVGVFIVLSGYSLMLPVARSSSGELQGGWHGYLVRRAKRIFPAYYAALALSIPTYCVICRNHALPLDGNAVMAHVFLVHNLNPHWIWTVNSPLWSVATEWQIYFFLPFVLLPVWQRFGIAATVSVAFALGYLPHLALPYGHNGDLACPWYLGLFGLGMLGAVLTERTLASAHELRSRSTLWLIASICLFAFVFAAFFRYGKSELDYAFLLDPICGLGAMCLIVACTIASRERVQTGVAHRVVVLLQTPALQTLGGFSYSLYLTHFVVYHAAGWALDKTIHAPLALFAARYLILLPMMLVFAYAFSLLFNGPLYRAERGRSSLYSPSETQRSCHYERSQVSY